jgi:hypothetical protein
MRTIVLSPIRSNPTKTADGTFDIAENRIIEDENAIKNDDSGLLKTVSAIIGEAKTKIIVRITPVASSKTIV